MERRRLLKLVSGTASAGAAWTAGCLDDEEPADDDEDTVVGGRWSTYGYDDSNTGYSDLTTGPMTEPEVRWTADVDGVVFETPAVTEDRVYAATAEDGSLHAFDRDGGDVWNWRFDEDAVGWLRSPTVVEGTVYTAGGDGKVYAVDADEGETEWESEVGFDVSSPTVSGGVVYVSSDDGLYAFDASDGEPLGPDGGRIADDAGSGAVPAVGGGRVYASTTGTDAAVYAVEAPGSEGIESVEEPVWETSADDADTWFSNPSPTYHDGTVYAVLGRGRLHAFDASDGGVVWEQPVGLVGSGASVAVVDGVVYVAAVDDSGVEVVLRVVAVESEDGTPLWTADVSTSQQLSPDFLTRLSPVVAGDTVYVRGVPVSDGGPSTTVAAFNRRTSEQRWTAEYDGVVSNLAAAGGELYAGRSAEGDGEGGTAGGSIVSLGES